MILYPKDIIWFKDKIETKMNGYEIHYRFFSQGGFGSLNQVEFNSERIGGGIDFWSEGWIGIHLVEYSTGNELLNILLNPEQDVEKEESFNKLLQVI